MQRFDIYFSGQLLDDADPIAVRTAVGRLFKIEGEALDRLFSGSRIRIKKAVDVATASRFRASFRKAGALLDIVVCGQPAPKPRPPAASKPSPPMRPPAAPPVEETAEPVSDALSMDLLPPRTGSLEDCAETVIAPPIPDTDWMTLDQPGATVDRTPPPPPAEIDTGGLSMGEANSGSLADCRTEVPPQPIGDVSWMALDNLGTPVDQSPPVTPANIPTDELQLEETGSGSLENLAPAKTTQPLPNIDHLRLLDDDPKSND